MEKQLCVHTLKQLYCYKAALRKEKLNYIRRSKQVGANSSVLVTPRTAVVLAERGMTAPVRKRHSFVPQPAFSFVLQHGKQKSSIWK